MEGPKKGHPLYLGLFATDPKAANSTVQTICKESILEVLKHCNPEGYLQEGEKLPEAIKQH